MAHHGRAALLFLLASWLGCTVPFDDPTPPLSADDIDTDGDGIRDGDDFWLLEWLAATSRPPLTFGGTASNDSTASGGNHGGLGGRRQDNGTLTDALTYDDLLRPRFPGGGGHDPNVSSSRGGAGGGVVHLAVAGTLQLDGELFADGAHGPVYVFGANSWGGGGGRVAVYAQESDFDLEQVETHGGISPREGASWRGGAGTAVQVGPDSPHGNLRIDNADVLGQDTPLLEVGGGRVNELFPDQVTIWDVTLARPSNLALLDNRSVRFGDEASDPVFSITAAYGPTTLTLDVGDTDLRELLVHGQTFHGLYVFDDVTISGAAGVSVEDTFRVEGTLDTVGGSLAAPRLEVSVD